MLYVQSKTVGVTLASGTILQVRESNSYNRVFYFHNLSSNVLTLTIQESTDGGATWTAVGVAFDVGVAGGGSDVVQKNITSTNILRVIGNGGGDDRDMYIGLVYFKLVADTIWVQ